MQPRSIPMTTVILNFTSILAILGLIVMSGDFRKGNWGELIMATLVFSFPSVLLAAMGKREINSRRLSRILLCCTIASTTLWILVAGYFATAPAIDAQSGLLVALGFVLQLGIIAAASVSFLLFRNR